MSQPAVRLVVFADLRSSTGLYEVLGNAHAAVLVSRTVAQLGKAISARQGLLVKTLGDGLMAIFEDPAMALQAAVAMHQSLAIINRDGWPDISCQLQTLRLQVGMAYGEVVQVGEDFFGDAVNIAARLLEHASDNETLVTSTVVETLPAQGRLQLRRLDRLQLRGRVEPVEVFVLEECEFTDLAATLFGSLIPATQPDGLRLVWQDRVCNFSTVDIPVVIGRSELASCRIDDNRVSRSHARIEWHGGAFQLVDLSSNGTFVQFAGDATVITLRRSNCTLHGTGVLGLGAPPDDTSAPCVRFEVMHPGDPRGR
jgi:adenylate cyclase